MEGCGLRFYNQQTDDEGDFGFRAKSGAVSREVEESTRGGFVFDGCWCEE